MYRLEAGYEAFLVGGAVRDLLLGNHAEGLRRRSRRACGGVAPLFQDLRLVGPACVSLACISAARSSKFRHLWCRSGAGAREDAEAGFSRSKHPACRVPERRLVDNSAPERVLRDNVFGTIEVDVWRRDFAATVCTQHKHFSIWDFVDGARRRATPDADQDPERAIARSGRMLRAVVGREADSSIDAATVEPSTSRAPAGQRAPARLFNSALKLSCPVSGPSAACCSNTDVRAFVSVSAAAFRCRPTRIRSRMLESDSPTPMPRDRCRQPVTPTFCSRCCCGGQCCANSNGASRPGPGSRAAQSLRCVPTPVLRAQQSRVAIPRRFAVPMRELLMLQPRFNRRSGVKSLELLQHPRFRAAYRFPAAAGAGRAWRIRNSRSGGPTFKCCPRRSASSWCRRGRADLPPAERRIAAPGVVVGAARRGGAPSRS